LHHQRYSLPGDVQTVAACTVIASDVGVDAEGVAGSTLAAGDVLVRLRTFGGLITLSRGLGGFGDLDLGSLGSFDLEDFANPLHDTTGQLLHPTGNTFDDLLDCLADSLKYFLEERSPPYFCFMLILSLLVDFRAPMYLLANSSSRSRDSTVFSGGGGAGAGAAGVGIFGGLTRHTNRFLQNVAVLFIEDALEGTHYSAFTYAHPDFPVGPLGIRATLRVEVFHELHEVLGDVWIFGGTHRESSMSVW